VTGFADELGCPGAIERDRPIAGVAKDEVVLDPRTGTRPLPTRQVPDRKANRAEPGGLYCHPDPPAADGQGLRRSRGFVDRLPGIVGILV